MSDSATAKQHHIVVNGQQREVSQDELTFHEICKIAFPQGPFSDTVTYTVTFEYKNGEGGPVVKGESVKIKEGTVFNVGKSDKS